MKKEQLSDALGNLSDGILQEAAQKSAKKSRRRRRPVWVGSVAAVLAVAVLAAAFFGKSTRTEHSAGETGKKTGLLEQIIPTALCVAAPTYPKTTDEEIWASYRDLADNGSDFYVRAAAQVLGSSDGKNVVFSPLNLYFALAMLTECTEGESRQQLLDVLGADSAESLRETVDILWRTSFADDEHSRSTLANSLWLSEDCAYREDTVQTLAEAYYASVYQGTMGSDELNTALQDWLDKETGGLLGEQAKQVETDALTYLMLASTLYYQSRWMDEFDPVENTEGIFHGAAGDENATFLHKNGTQTYYYGENYGAMALTQSNGGQVWLILPDEGVSAETLAASGIPITLATGYVPNGGSTYCQVNLSMPKTDVQGSANLQDALQALGVTDLWTAETADFSGIFAEAEPSDVYLAKVQQDARLVMDEQGVTAAAFTVEEMATECAPEDGVVEFCLDRPFLVVVTNMYRQPIMTALVNSVG